MLCEFEAVSKYRLWHGIGTEAANRAAAMDGVIEAHCLSEELGYGQSPVWTWSVSNT